MKTETNRKNGKKKHIGLYLLGGVAVLAACGSICTPVYAKSEAEYTKTENVYTNFDSDGSQRGTYVVNNFHVEKEGEISDIGDYDKIINLTNLEDIKSDKKEQNFEAEEGSFYYQGNIEQAILPWNIELCYYLDGDEIKSDDLAGASGDLEIVTKIKTNPAMDNIFYSSTYMLQVSFVLDEKLCQKIEAEGATIVDAGSNAQITYTVMPGQAETVLYLSAEVENFEMDNISINGAQVVFVNPETGESIGNTPSYTSIDNANTTQVMYMMSVDGIKIPEVVKTPVKIETKSFVQKLKELINKFF